MIKSMTGFASLTRDDDIANLSVTIRSVNHRFLDLQLRLPPALAGLESTLRSLVQQHVSRGRVEVTVAVQPRRAQALEVELNEPLLHGLVTALNRARVDGYVDGPLTPGDLIRFPQAFAIRDATADAAEDDVQSAALATRVEGAVHAALIDLNMMRIREGGFLQAELDARRARVGEMFEKVAALSEGAIESLRERLAERVRELRADALTDDVLVAQEIVRFAGRSDITEEVVRFRGHLEHWQTLSDSPEPCGRKLDFLLQEMNREVNTTGSKAEGPSVSELIVALKAELEKMREQVQNVE